MGVAFGVLAGVMVWRHREVATIVCATLGATLILGGLVAPRALLPVERAWMGLAHAISKVTTPLAMGIVYYIVLTPIGLAMRGMGRNPLVRREEDGGYWVKHEAHGSDMTHQF